MSLFEYLARRFAEMLTKGDVLELFRMLEQRHGTISSVCERVGIERKTFYNWKYAKQISTETKFKVLKVALEEHPIDTLEFLARKSRERTKEILELLLELLYKEMLEEKDHVRAERTAKRAEEILNEFSIPITEYLRHGIAKLIKVAYNRGFNIRIRPYISVQSSAVTFRAITEEYGASTSNTGTLSAPESPPVSPQVAPEATHFATLER